MLDRSRINAAKASSPATVIRGDRPVPARLDKKQLMIPNRTFNILAAALAIALSGCETTATTSPSPELLAAPTETSLAPGDVLRLGFPGAPELNQVQKIQPTGKVNLPLIGEVEAAGKNVSTFREELSRLYKAQLQNTAITLTVESSVLTVVVSGAVKGPGKMIFEHPTTVLEAIM